MNVCPKPGRNQIQAQRKTMHSPSSDNLSDRRGLTARIRTNAAMPHCGHDARNIKLFVISEFPQQQLIVARDTKGLIKPSVSLKQTPVVKRCLVDVQGLPCQKG
jgi:hypothetical protein